MRVWSFDRLGGIASEQFDINEDGLQFVFTILGFLWMNEEQLGFDPTIMTANKERFIEIKRNGMIERIIIDEVMQRARCIAGRATTCWKAHREGQPEIPLVIKDSWQYSERHEEGDLLREVTRKCVVNVARYYHHETVQICGEGDDIRSNVRGGLDITRAANYQPERPIPPSSIVTSTLRKGRSSSTTSRKRSSSQTGAPPQQAILLRVSNEGWQNATKSGTSACHSPRLWKAHIQGELSIGPACCSRRLHQGTQVPAQGRLLAQRRLDQQSHDQ